MEPSRRNTRQRTLVLDAVKSSHSHPNAEEVYAAVQTQMPNISLGTVYRNLSLLEQMKEIVRIHSDVGGDRFDGVTQEHPHFICTQCGRVFDLECDIEKETALVKESLQKHTPQIQQLQIIALGLCEECQKNTKEK